jgi:hypothetical protein
MRILPCVITVILTLGAAIAALAQSPDPTPPPAVQNNDAPATPVVASRLFACQIAAKGLQGQERQDQIQLCRAQAHLDCLNQAIDQRVAGPQRRDFMWSCMQQ